MSFTINENTEAKSWGISHVSTTQLTDSTDFQQVTNRLQLTAPIPYGWKGV